MGRPIFITGAGGFAGRRVLARLQALGGPVIALDRSGSLASASAPPQLAVVRGDLTRPESYRAALAGCDTVVHLAAATGRAAADLHARINVDGTAALVDACREAGVSRLLFVSSIAAGFPDLRGYAYGRSKRDAEDVVRRSGLRLAIVRPTMIFGPGSPVQASLERLATLPAAVVPGRGTVRVQPIEVDDVARAIVEVISLDWFDGETFEIGGRDTVTVDQLLLRMRRVRRPDAQRIVHVPLALLQPPLRAAELIGLLRVLPLSAGQLTSFAVDGVASPNALQDRLRDAAGLDTMLEAAGAERRAPETITLDRECETFARHLIGQAPNHAVRATYADAHRQLGLDPDTRFDRLLLAIARRGPWLTRMTDGYAALFARRAVLRKKLVLLLAILETCPPFYRDIDRTLPGSRGAIAVKAAGRVGVAAVLLLAGVALLAPAHALLGTRRRS
jgi:NADH dehydrogenase